MSTTPMMSQWNACKLKARDALLLFRLGDFYEAFHEDAKVVSQALGLVLTQRQGIPMCGVPVHVVDSSIDRLIAKGHKVAIAEQEESSLVAKGLIKRGLSRIITPGTVIHSELIQEKKNHFIASVIQVGRMYGLSFLDVTTGEFFSIEWNEPQSLIDELHRLRPTEFLTSHGFISAHPQLFTQLSLAFPFLVNEREETQFDALRSIEALCSHFSTPFESSAAHCAAGALLIYLKEELSLGLSHVTQLRNLLLQQTMSLDPATIRNLELLESINLKDSKHTLLDLLDRTATPMGARLLKIWVTHPELSLMEIRERGDTVAQFLSTPSRMKLLHQLLKGVRDLERLISKIASKTASPRDLFSLGHSLAQVPALAAEFPLSYSHALSSLSAEILSSLNEQLPQRASDGALFKEGVYPELDRLRTIQTETTSWIARYQTELRAQTGIKTLKVGYTRAFGYYIEVSKSKGEQVPESFQKRQTLVNSERFTTEILKVREGEVLLAEERAIAFEMEAYERLRERCAYYVAPILSLAHSLARLDVLLSFALVAQEEGFVRPTLDEGDQIIIRNGRHPVLERAIGKSRFIPNDCSLSPSSRQLLLLTGPNMAGKSTYIRQVALIVLLAQIGSYVPADSAHIGLVDKLFSRIGASDDLARGQSTFMVEMSETANILRNATSRSLILLDEIGRGTSTYDGIALAWAVAEYLLTTEGKKAKTLFATHYWELTRLEQQFPILVNMHMAIQEIEGGILFLHKVFPGAADRSYGIHVAKLAGLPPSVIQRAEEVLSKLEKQEKEPLS